mgnify:CR=1 FL=1
MMVRATNGLTRKRQELVAELIKYGFKSGAYTNTEVKLNTKKEVTAELLNPDAVFGVFPEGRIAAEDFLGNLAACQTLWANIQMAVSVFESIFDYLEGHHLLEFFSAFIETFHERLGFSLILFLSSSGLNNSSLSPEQKQMQELQVGQSLAILSVFAEMIQVYFKSCRCVKGANTQIMLNLMGSISILDKLFSVRMGNLCKDEKNIIFDPTDKPQINSVLAKFKNHVLDSVRMLLDFYNHDGKYVLTRKQKDSQVKEEHRLKNQKFFLHLNSIIRLSINALLSFFQSSGTNIDAICEDVDLHSLIVASVGIFTGGAYHSEVFDSLAERKTELLQLIYLPCCGQSQEMLQNLLENPDDYVIRNHHFRAAQRTDYNIRMISLHSLKMLCSNIDGFLSEVINLLFNTVKVSMNLQTPEQIPDELERRRFVNLTQQNFWSGVEPRMRVDCCFLILSQLFEQVLLRNDLVKRIEVFVKQVFKHLTVECEDHVIATRMVLFCGRYLKLLFQEEPEKQVDMIKWIIGNLPLKDARGSAAEMMIFEIMALESKIRRNQHPKTHRFFLDMPEISGLIIQNLMERLTQDFRPNLIEAFLNLNKGNPQFFVDNPAVFEKYFTNLVVIVQQISKETNDSQKPLISNIWFLIKQVCQIKEIYLKYRDFIEAKVAQLFYLVNEMQSQNNFDTDLVDCLVAWNSHSKEVSPHALSFIPFMATVQAKNKGCLGSLYNLLNNYFIFAKSKFSISDVQMVLGMALKSISASEVVEKKQENILNGIRGAKGVLRIQMILVNIAEFMLDPTLESIIQVFKQFYLKNLGSIQGMYEELDYFDDNYENCVIESSQPMLYFDKMMGVFLMGAYLFPNKVLTHFLEFEFSPQVMEEHRPLKLSFIVDLICSRFDEFSTPYDQKLWMVSFSKMVEFFLKMFLESNRNEYLAIIKNLVHKSVLILKGFQLFNKMSREHWGIQQHSEYMDLFVESCDEFNEIRQHLQIKKQAQSRFNTSMSGSNFDYDDDDEDEGENTFNFVQIEKFRIMHGVKSPILDMDEIREFRHVMEAVRQHPVVMDFIRADMPPIVLKYFTKVAFEFERVGKGIRNIRKLKRRRAN